jgi:hypothetical protein
VVRKVRSKGIKRKWHMFVQKVKQENINLRYLKPSKVKKVERIGRGADFRVTTTHPITGKVIKREIVEVKTGKSKDSPLQEKTKKKKRNYKVVHVEPTFF